MSKGKIGVSTQDLFPIIKKFLYSDHEIFLRELVSNAVDATQKLKTLASSGVFKGGVENLQVRVKADKEAGTLTISDNGIGMTSEEVEKYINQIAFSGAEEFLKQYKDSPNAIIGHFGLGFYSAFMVSDRVEIFTRSYKDDAKGVHWSCQGTTDYEMEEYDKPERGTDVVLHLTKEDLEFAGEEKIQSLLKKYCRFLPVEVVCGKEKEWKDGGYKDTDRDLVINDTHPAWTRKPSELKEEDYGSFYHDLYPVAADPLFHIHLNVDYPFTLTGILYFPKISSRMELQKNKIQLYCNQVYVTDTVEGIVPEYLTLLHGVIDSPDIPLNVSRSYLQSDRNVKKISSHITKKVADSLLDLFKNKRADFESKWDDLKIFVQYGILTDEKFAERAMEFYLFKNTDGKYFSLEEYKKVIADTQTDKDKKLVFLYASKTDSEYSYIQAAKAKGYDVLVMDGTFDTPFLNFMEQKNPDFRFTRVDSDVIDRLIVKEEARQLSLDVQEQSELRGIFNAQLPKDGGMYAVSFENMGEEADPVLITRSEFMRRMKDMAEINPDMGFYGKMGDQLNLVVNADHRLVKELLQKEKAELGDKIAPILKEKADLQKQKDDIEALNKDTKPEEIPASDKDRIADLDRSLNDLGKKERDLLEKYGAENPVVGQLIDLALLSNGLLKGEGLHRFLKRSVDMIK
ncbi:MAG: molecular chaperone HtpG [Bacteroides sp.]|nr:molecular chaperone HtpG [Bacteroides sp.]MCM1086199.1 molecular chaperone HtpG [Bacteroides sp.]